MNRRTKQQATLQHLRSLANQPNEQARYALELLERERGKQVASEALAALTNSPVTEVRPILLRLYEYYDEAGVKRDAGGDLRIAFSALCCRLLILGIGRWPSVRSQRTSLCRQSAKNAPAACAQQDWFS